MATKKYEPSITQMGPNTRLVKTGTGMESGHNLEVHKKVGNDWKKHWGTNEMSNNYAYTEAKKIAQDIENKHAAANAPKTPAINFEKERDAHGWLSSKDRQKLIDRGEYKGYKKGGKASSRKSMRKNQSW